MSDWNQFLALVREAARLGRCGQTEAAIALAERAATINPGHAAPFTIATILKLRRHFGSPPPAQPPNGRPPVSMTSLGLNGRFGNQLLQYGFLKLYAQRHGLCAQTPDWVGRDLFGCDDPFPAQPLSHLDEAQTDLIASLTGTGPVYADRDLSGYFCGPTARWQAWRDDFRALFRPRQAIAAALAPLQAQVEARGRTLVAIHLRRGDFGSGRFWIASSAWYRDWLARLWPGLDRPVLYIASDDPAAVAEFADYTPLDAQQLGAGALDFYCDHWLLSRARHLAVSNSSFSVTAAMLNIAAESLVRPDPGPQGLRPFDPWAEAVLLPPGGLRETGRTF